MKLTKRQRDEAVMILRCAADDCISRAFIRGLLIISVLDGEGPDASPAARAAYLAWDRVLSDNSSLTLMLEDTFLEAALLVDEGVLP